MVGRRLPELGGRGEGWFLLQVVLFGAIAVSGAVGPAWGGWPAAVGIATGGILIGCGGLLSLRGLLDLRENLTPFPNPSRVPAWWNRAPTGWSGTPSTAA